MNHLTILLLLSTALTMGIATYLSYRFPHRMVSFWGLFGFLILLATSIATAISILYLTFFRP